MKSRKRMEHIYWLTAFWVNHRRLFNKMKKKKPILFAEYKLLTELVALANDKGAKELFNQVHTKREKHGVKVARFIAEELKSK